MTWNHRVFKDDSGCFTIREVYYNDKGKSDSFTIEPISPFGENIGELRWELEQMMKALKRPVLTKADFEPSSGDEGADN
jgi:hypothetical protein